jgi:hypothetical protein
VRGDYYGVGDVYCDKGDEKKKTTVIIESCLYLVSVSIRRHPPKIINGPVGKDLDSHSAHL